MKITKRQLQQMIAEEVETLEYTIDARPGDDDVDNVEAEEDAWAGGANLVDPIDFEDVTGMKAPPKGVEVLKITESRLRKIIRQEKLRFLRESMEELPPPGADRKQLASTDAMIMAEDYIQYAVYEGLEEMGLDESAANEVIRQLYNRPDLLKDAIVNALNDYKRKLSITGRPKPRGI